MKTFERSDNIIKFLKDHPLISIRALESELKIPETTISLAMLRLRNIPFKYWDDLENHLQRYGFEKE